MGLIVTSAPKQSAVSAIACVIGKTYRRQSEPTKLYIAARSYDSYGKATDLPMLISLDHGNRVTLNLHLPDFIEVRIQAQVTDVL